jgi:hypothetical protein
MLVLIACKPTRYSTAAQQQVQLFYCNLNAIGKMDNRICQNDKNNVKMSNYNVFHRF